jgi:MFS family permease
VPTEHRANFRHLYQDIAGFAVLNGTAITFMQVYATRAGAGSLALGLITALPAIVALGLTLPAGIWLRHRPATRVTVYTAIASRFFYLVWALLPWLGNNERQVTLLLLTTFVMSIPGAFLAVSFNALYAEAVPVAWRPRVVGVRNSIYAALSIVTTLISGQILERWAFPLGYQIVFALGFAGSVWSTWHLMRIRPIPAAANRPRHYTSLNELARPGLPRGSVSGRTSVGLRALAVLRTDRGVLRRALQGRFRTVLGLLFVLHFMQYFSVPLHPLRYVNEMELSDQIISLGNAIFYAMLFLVSARFEALSKRYPYRRLIAAAIIIMACFPFGIAISASPVAYLIANLFGGSGIALLMGAVGNYVLQQVPEGEEPPVYLAWYNLVLNAAVLSGALVGSLVGDWVGLVPALLLAAALRTASGLLVWFAKL